MLLVNTSPSVVYVDAGYIKSTDLPFRVSHRGRKITIDGLSSHHSGNPLVTYCWNFAGFLIAGALLLSGNSVLMGIGCAVALFCIITSNTSANINIVNNGVSVQRNGVRVSTSTNDETGIKSYYIGDVAFSSVSVTGSGGIHLCQQSHADASLSVTVTGSGNVTLDGLSLGRLDANVIGSGDIVGADTTIGAAILRITGSGDIRGFHIANWTEGTIYGSGTIECSIDRQNCEANKYVYGSGDVVFYRK